MDAVGDIPLAGFLAKIPKHVDRLGKKALDLYRKRNEKALHRIPHLQANEIEKRLPGLWTYDFNNSIREADKRAVLFFDTYEALREHQREEIRRHNANWWIREFIKGLPGTLIVVTGHEKLYWSEIDKSWEKAIRQLHVGDLTSQDAHKILLTRGIEDKAIRNRVVVTAKGVPFDLVWATEVPENILRQGEPPSIEDFGGTPWELGRCFFRYLEDHEVAILELLAVPRFFDRNIVQALAETFDPGFRTGHFNRLVRFAFVEQVYGKSDSREIYSLHDRARDTILEHAQFFPETERIHNFLFEYYTETFENLNSREVGPKHEQSFQEAFYHGQHTLNVNDFGEWFFEKEPIFNQAARWQMLIALYEKLLDLQKKVIGEKKPQTAKTLNSLAGIYRWQGNYEEAESLYNRVLKIRKSTLGVIHPRFATTLHNLGQLYCDQGMYDEAELMLTQALEIEELAFGDKHSKVATTINSLAGLYRDRGKYMKAESFYNRALKIRKITLGEEHPQIATTLYNLGMLYDKQERQRQAIQILERALTIAHHGLGQSHHKTQEISTLLKDIRSREEE